MGDTLQGDDYAHMPFKELFRHPNYDPEAFKTVMRVMRMSNEQLRNLPLGAANGR